MSAKEDPVVSERAEVISIFRHLKPGDQVDLQFNTEVVPIRIKAKLLGFDESKFIILSVPPSAFVEYSDVLTLGETCVVRMLIEGEAGQCIAFISEIKTSPFRPKNLLFISFPQRIQSISLRKDSRVLTKIPVRIANRTQDSEANPQVMFKPKSFLSGFIRDISASGCRIEVQSKFKEVTIKAGPVFIQISSGVDEAIIIKAVIKNQHPIDPTRFSLGLAFEEDAALNEFLSNLAIQ